MGVRKLRFLSLDLRFSLIFEANRMYNSSGIYKCTADPRRAINLFEESLGNRTRKLWATLRFGNDRPKGRLDVRDESVVPRRNSSSFRSIHSFFFDRHRLSKIPLKEFPKFDLKKRKIMFLLLMYRELSSLFRIFPMYSTINSE